MSKPLLQIDFDGTIHAYDGLFSARLGMPLPNARRACVLLADKFNISYLTSRGSSEEVVRWLKANGFPNPENVSYVKNGGLIVDDGAITFEGEWTEELLERIKNFKRWWKK